jgi:hypothetical protein
MGRAVSDRPVSYPDKLLLEVPTRRRQMIAAVRSGVSVSESGLYVAFELAKRHGS